MLSSSQCSAKRELTLKQPVALALLQFLTVPPTLAASDILALLPTRLATAMAELRQRHSSRRETKAHQLFPHALRQVINLA
jgi:hypothetical protein